MNNFVFICLMVLIVFISLIDNYENRKLKKDIIKNKNLIKKLEDEVEYNCYYSNDLEEKHKLIYDKCDKTIKEFNEIMFGNPPLKNKVIIVRSIKDYDYSAYRKDIEALNEYLDKGWTIVNHESNEFVHTYILGMPLKWLKEGDVNDE